MCKLDEALLRYEEKNYGKAYALFKECHQEEGKKENFTRYYSFKYIKTIYETKIKNLKDLDIETQKDIIYILKNLQKKDLFYKLTIFKVVEFLEKENNPNWDKILVWLKKLDIDYLSLEKPIYEVEGKKIELPSELEKYFSRITKIYEKEKDYENLYSSCQEALNKIKEFTNNSDVWIKRRLAMCYSNDENYQEALRLYKEILISKKDWYLYREIGELYWKLENKQDAILNYFEAFTKSNDLSKISNLLHQIIDHLDDDIENKRKFLLLDLALKKEKNLDFSINEYKEFNITEEDIDKINTEKYFKNLRNEISDLKLSYQDRKQGTVVTVNERYCFIESEENRYFCQMKEFPKRVAVERGLNVEFSLVESFDKRKNQASYQAKDIRVLGGK
ncbi:lipopolysaccharide assembly protein LapB [uncultured Fusobacterium sp.]|uniref:tetratricopeptide repeat protein n=1 Tax=uncultured Fusobacterium sp. TaxID=159267 RepID=UPI0015A557D1|nr:hypothetical protein [uncultured Fusobacterium sp.]